MERIRIRTNIDGSGSGFREVQNHTDPNPQHYRLVNRYDTCRGTEIDFFKKHHELANERKAFHFNSICSVLFLWCLLLSLVLLSSSSCEFIVSFFLWFVINWYYTFSGWWRHCVSSGRRRSIHRSGHGLLRQVHFVTDNSEFRKAQRPN